MDAVAERGRNLVSIRFSLSMEEEQANAGRDGRTCLARPILWVRTGRGEFFFSCSADHEQDWQRYPVDLVSTESADHTFMLS